MQPLNSSLLQQSSVKNLKRAFGWHWKLNVAALVLGAVAFAAIVLDKLIRDKKHFHSLHAIWGLTTFVTAFVIGGVGWLLKWVPNAFGGTAQAKRLYPIHRAFGYVLTAILLVTLYYALEKKWVKERLGMILWTANIVSIPVIAGLLFIRIVWSKLAFVSNQRQQ
jgi:hypothetical protein